ncbi:hypothetical protein RS130_03840 [Paraglaciecola aquimarina]|uniref:Tetratricopeptide repeat protein n=1 Tax=Paraglaciecola aquimarina TaxID=1235557 RepID=A0ABU3ST39_9ALTE|nr:hypothetical protein [Paraglaciecola aquimarina]MDU0353180.1 hypothetical protein [Paraglaciecola aquimarina]
MNPSAVIELNCAVSLANAGQPVESYQQLLKLEKALDAYQPYYAARAELEAQLGDQHSAIASLKIAIKLSQNNSERDFLINKLERLNTPQPQ